LQSQLLEVVEQLNRPAPSHPLPPQAPLRSPASDAAPGTPADEDDDGEGEGEGSGIIPLVELKNIYDSPAGKTPPGAGEQGPSHSASQRL